MYSSLNESINVKKIYIYNLCLFCFIEYAKKRE